MKDFIATLRRIIKKERIEAFYNERDYSEWSQGYLRAIEDLEVLMEEIFEGYSD